MAEQKIRYSVLGALGGLIAGIVLFDKTAENKQLITERDRIQAQLAELSASLPRVKTYTHQVHHPTTSPRDSALPMPARNGSSFRFEITEEDRRLMAEMRNRQKNGEYINQLENPLTRKMLQRSISKGVEMLAEKNRTNLSPVLASLGLPDDVSKQLLAHVSKINEAAMEAQASIDQLLTARWAYDQRMQALLTPAEYQRYQKYEASGPAREAYEKIQHFAEQEKIPLESNERESLVTIIQESQAYPEQNYLGPYDGLPTVAVGKENVLQNAEQRLAEVNGGANRALQLAAERGLSEQSIDLLFTYYNQDVQKRIEEIERIRDPRTEQRIHAEMERRVQEDQQRLQHELAEKRALNPKP